jgi:hypothetical protein
MLEVDFTFEHAVMIDGWSDVRPVLSAHEQRVRSRDHIDESWNGGCDLGHNEVII